MISVVKYSITAGKSYMNLCNSTREQIQLRTSIKVIVVGPGHNRKFRKKPLSLVLLIILNLITSKLENISSLGSVVDSLSCTVITA